MRIGMVTRPKVLNQGGIAIPDVCVLTTQLFERGNSRFPVAERESPP